KLWQQRTYADDSTYHAVPHGRQGTRRGLPGPDVASFSDRVADDFPSQGAAHPPQLAGLVMPEADDVVGLERHDKILAVAADRYLSPKKRGVFSEGFHRVERRHNAISDQRATHSVMSS